MNLKYYLRGLGIGIIVTAVIMGVSKGSGKQTLSDSEIRARAEQLGMVMQGTSLADTAKEEVAEETSAPKKPEPAAEASSTPETTPTPETVSEEEPEERVVATPTPEEASSLEAVPTPEPEESAVATSTPEAASAPETEETSSKNTITLEVKRGDGSYAVARRAEAAGLVENATAFDAYMCSEGYDRRLRVGSFSIPENATEEQIIEILCVK